LSQKFKPANPQRGRSHKSRRRTPTKKKVTLSKLAKFGEQLPAIHGLDSAPYGPALAWVGDADFKLGPPIDFAKDWLEMPPHMAWEILAHRRAIELFPDAECEFRIYTELLQRSSPRYQSQIFLGLLAGKQPTPVLVPRYICGRHVYILGGTGRGKTSYAITQLLLQLSDYTVDEFGNREENPPVVIFDLKFDGDKHLRATAERIAAKRGQKVRFFSNNPDFVSLKFDPLYCFRSVRYPLKLAETLMKALSVIYEGYGATFFSNEQRYAFLEILRKRRPDSFDQLVDWVRDATLGKQGNADARGLYSALVALKYAEHAHTDGSCLPEDERVDFERLYEKREVLYIHLDTRGLSMVSKDFGRLMLYALAETAAQRNQIGQKIPAIVVLDEFQRISAGNIVEMNEDARGAGLMFIYAHQTEAALRSANNEDLFAILANNCGLMQMLSAKDKRPVELMRLISGRERELRSSHSISVSTDWKGLPTVSESWTEQQEMVDGLIPEKLVKLHAGSLKSLIHVNAPDADMVTPLEGKPVVIQGLWPFSAEEAKSMSSGLWARNPPRDDAYYYRKSLAPTRLFKPKSAEEARLLVDPTKSTLVSPTPPATTPAAEISPTPSAPEVAEQSHQTQLTLFSDPAVEKEPASSNTRSAAVDETQGRVDALRRLCERLARQMLSGEAGK
jgi:hypothetical protein